MARKILYSPGYGAGWTSWSSGAAVPLMLTYQPIIDAIERGEAMSEEHPAVVQLVAECEALPGSPHCCILGASDLRVAEVTGLVRIEEYDGSESYEEEGEYDGWL